MTSKILLDSWIPLINNHLAHRKHIHYLFYRGVKYYPHGNLGQQGSSQDLLLFHLQYFKHNAFCEAPLLDFPLNPLITGSSSTAF